MNLLFITFEFPPQPGGIGTYTYEIAKHLAEFGHDVTMLAYSHAIPEQLIVDFDKKQPFRTIRFKVNKTKIGKIIHRIFKALQVVRKKRFHLIFISHPHAGIIALFIKWLYNIPYVMMGHGSEFQYNNLFLKWVMVQIFNHSNVILTNSQYTTKLVKESGISNTTIHTIPLGADDKLYNLKNFDQEEIKEKYGFKGRQIILTVGNLSQRKGHRFVIEAIERLKEEFPNILYLIVGRGKKEQEIRALIEQKKLDKYIKMIGFVPLEQLPEYYAMCDIFVLNSTIAESGDVEGFGIVLIEANLMGKPVIGTKNCGIEDAIEHNKSGLIVPMDDTEATMQALRLLLNNPQLRIAMGEYGYRRAKEKYTWKKVAYETEKVLKEIIK